MKKLTLFLVLWGFNLVLSQETNIPKLSLSFENAKRVEVLNTISTQTGIQFYFVDKWLDESLISGSYTDTALDVILEAVFEDTPINFYLLNEKRVVLTQNSIIYNALPEGFFGKEPIDSVAVVQSEAITTTQGTRGNPVFYAGNKSASRTKKVETVSIGKEDPNNQKSSYLLQGYAYNARTGEPIANLAILFKGRAGGVATNENGFYEIELRPGLNVLETRSLGVSNTEMRIIIYNDGRLDLNLEESLEALDEVVVEATINRNVTETTTGTEEIDVEESKNIPLVLGERDVLKVATTLPGITTAGEGAAGFNVRGGKADQNLILFDNAVVYNPQHFFGIFSALNPFVISDVNIFKGSIPAEYGGRLSSVFDIKTKDANIEKFSGEASLGPVTGNLTLELPVVKGKSGLFVAGRGAYANYILNSLDDESLNDSEASFYDITAKYNHKINEKNSISGTAYFSRDDFSITSDSLFIYSNRLFSLQSNHRFNDKNSADISLTNSQYKFDIEFEGDSNANFNVGYDINETELKIKLRHLFSDKVKVDYGVSSKLYDVSPGRRDPLGPNSNITPFSIPDEQGLESAAFVSGVFDVTDKFSINAGIRYSFFAALGAGSQRVFAENSPRNESTVIDTLNFGSGESIATYGGPEIRVSGRYLITPDFSIKGGFSNTYQYIHTLSNNTTVSPIDVWKLSDLNIEPQQASQVSLGLFKNFDANKYELSLEGFYKESENILDFKVGAQTLLNETIDTQVLQGDGRSFGVEFLIRKNSGKLNGWLGYTYSRSMLRLDSAFDEERINNGEFFPSNFDKPHDISLVANYKLTRRFSLSTNFVYQTGRPVTFPVGNFNFNGSDFVVFSDRNAFRIPDFYRLDIGLNVEGNHKIKKFAHSFWTISIYNVLGRNNPFSVFFITEDGEVRGQQSSIFSIPIPTITYNFKF